MKLILNKIVFYKNRNENYRYNIYTYITSLKCNIKNSMKNVNIKTIKCIKYTE